MLNTHLIGCLFRKQKLDFPQRLKVSFCPCFLLNHLHVFMFTSLFYDFSCHFSNPVKVIYYSTLLATFVSVSK